ncbi:unnamed protein product, partial [Scytosiphon promiscuus]
LRPIPGPALQSRVLVSQPRGGVQASETTREEQRMSAVARNDNIVADSATSESKPTTPRSILRRDVPASSSMEGAPRKRVTFEGSVPDEKPGSG